MNRWWLAGLVVACVGLVGATMAPALQYKVGAFYGASPSTACTAYLAGTPVVINYSCDGVTHSAQLYAVENGFPDYCQGWYHDACTGIATYGGTNEPITTEAGGCQSGFKLVTATGLCSNVNTIAGTPSNQGDCNKDVVQNMVISASSATANAPYLVYQGGCEFKLGTARLAYIDGVLSFVGQYRSTGDLGPGSTGSASAGTADVPNVTVSACASGNVIVSSAGVTTCLSSSEALPDVTQTGSENAVGSGVVTTTTCAGGMCNGQSSISGVVIAGSSGGVAGAPGTVNVNFPPGLATDATVGQVRDAVASAGGTLSSIHGDLTTLGVLSSPEAISTVSDVQALTADSLFAGLRSWSMPVRTVSCPTWGLNLTSYRAGWSWVIDGQCTVWNSGTVASDVQAVMLLVWALMALFIVLGA